MVTILANVRINSPERLQHMKDSFFSFNTVSDNWLINIRGDFRGEAISFLKENLGDKMVAFELLDDSRGWINNSLNMLKAAKYDYILVWNEDHLNIASQEDCQNAIKEMAKEKVDYMLYTYHPFWQKKFSHLYGGNIIKEGEHIDTVDITKKNISKFFPAQEKLDGIMTEKNECIIAGAAVFHCNFLRKIMKKEQFKLPIFFTRSLYRIMTGLNMLGVQFNQGQGYYFINKLFLYKLRKFPKETPFDLEITHDKHYVLPFKLGFPKKELFACIDDDLAVNGYQLVKRGLYPILKEVVPNNVIKESKEFGHEELLEKNKDYILQRIYLTNGKKLSERYYEDDVRTENLIRKTFVLISGKVVLSTGKKELQLSPGQSITLYPNLGYRFLAIEDSILIAASSGLDNKKIKYLHD